MNITLKHRLWVHDPTIYVLCKIEKTIAIFHLKNLIFIALKNRRILHRHVCVMFKAIRLWHNVRCKNLRVIYNFYFRILLLAQFSEDIVIVCFTLILKNGHVTSRQNLKLEQCYCFKINFINNIHTECDTESTYIMVTC